MGSPTRSIAAIVARVGPRLGGGPVMRLGEIIALGALAGATAGVIPTVMGSALDRLLGHAARDAGAIATILGRAPAWAAVLTAAGAVLFAVAVSVAASRRGSDLGGDLTAALRVELLGAALLASPHDLEGVGRAAMAEAAREGPPRPAAHHRELVKLTILRESGLTAELLIAVATGLPQAIVTLAVLSFELARGGATAVLVGAAALFLLSRLAADRASRRMSAALTAMQASDASIFAELGETLAGAEDLRLLGARGEALARFGRAAEKAAAARRRFASALAVSGPIKSVFSAASPLILLLALMISGRPAPPGEVATLLLVIPLLMARFEALDALRTGLAQRAPMLATIERLLALPSWPAASADPVSLDALGPGAITFDAVRFTPRGGARPVLDGCSLTIPAGAIVGICGRSGGGKSTLLRVLLRLDDPDAGAARIDGVDVRAIDPADLPRVFAVLGQSSRLFERSVGENLTLGLDPAPGEAHLREALARVDLDELSAGEARGLDTEVRATPPSFSGGEQRRILLARLFVREARVLVLDEPEAGLPSAQAEALLARVADVAAGRTTLVVTHAPHLLRSTFNVVIDGGRVVDQGPHEELAARSEAYRALLAEGLKRT